MDAEGTNIDFHFAWLGVNGKRLEGLNIDFDRAYIRP
jgi:hypothetical protein